MPDSLNRVYKIDSSRILNKIDSLPDPHKKIDSARFALDNKVDSLKSLNLSAEKYAQKLDSLRLSYENPVKRLEKKIGKKLDENPGLSNIDFPNAEMPKIEVPKANVDLPETSHLDAGKTGDMDKLRETAQFNDAMSEFDKAKGFPKEKVYNLQNTSAIEEATQGLEEVKEYTNQAGEYQKGLAEVKKGNLQKVEKRAEKEAMENIEEIGSLQQQAEGVKQGLPEQTDRNQYQAFVKQQMKEEAFERVSKEFSRNSGKIAQAQKELEKYKKKYARVQAIKSNPLKGKPFIERIVIGLQLEVLRNKATSLDLAPGFGYRVTRQLTIQGAWLYRLLFDNKAKSFQWQHPTYGPRLSASYMIYKGFFGNVSFERLRTNIPPNTIPEETSREWINGGSVGLGKAYSIVPFLKGNLQVLYNFLHNEKSPYSNKINIRLGFDFGFKKKAR